jgi:hypothetical protein
MARLEDMSPEEAFAAWEAMLGEEAVEEAAPPVPEAALPEEPVPAGPLVIEEPEKEPLVYPEGAGGEVTEAEADLMARLEDMSPEEAFAAWEAMLGEEAVEEAEPVVEADQAWMALAEDQVWEEAEVPAVDEELPAPEPAVELDQAWMTLAEDQVWEEVEAPAVAEELPTPEPAVEVDQAWMALAEDQVWEEVETPAVDEQMPTFALEEAELAPELPAWAVAEAAETILEAMPEPEEEPAMGPDWVLLTEEEATEIRIVEEPEPVAPLAWEPIEAEAFAVAEAPPVEPEPLAEAVAAAPMVEVPVVDERDDQARLELARRLWAAGQKEQAYPEYEQLIKSELLDDVIADLEKIATDEPSEEPALRLLGDAYMRDNRLQDALVAYRRALACL